MDVAAIDDDYAGAAKLTPLMTEDYEGRREAMLRARDARELQAIGKKPQLKRSFGMMAVLGFACTVLLSWERTSSTYFSGLYNGGPAGVVWGYILVWIGSVSTYVVLGELVSMAPTSGGQYHFVAVLAPASTSRYLSFVTAWCSICGWIASYSAGAVFSGRMIQGMAALCNPGYVPQLWQATLLSYPMILWGTLLNTWGGRYLPRFEGTILIVHVLGFFATLLPIVILGPRTTADEVFLQFYNGGGWPTQGLSFFVGLSGSVFTFIGGDGAMHMAEEVDRATTTVPRSLLLTVVINGLSGFGMVLALLFYQGDWLQYVDVTLDLPLLQVYRQIVSSTAGAIVMVTIILFLIYCASAGYLAACSRIIWSFARDRGVPGWRILHRLDPHSSLPVAAVCSVAFVGMLLCLIQIGSNVALTDVLSLTTSGLYSSYLMCGIMLLWRRLRGDIKPRQPGGVTITNAPGRPLSWGPWRIPGWWGIANNALSVCYLSVVLFFSFWPSSTPTSVPLMNYNVVCLGGTMILATLYYIFFAKEWTGPIIEIDEFKC